MAVASIKVYQSRFAALKVDDDSDEEKKPTKSNEKSSQQQQQQKKKLKKKKNNQNSQTAELKNLAFGKANPKVKKNQKTSSVNVNEKQWEDWKKNDEEFTTDIYEKDLQQALLLSRLEFEQKKPTKEKGNSSEVKTQAESKKKKKKEKQVIPTNTEQPKNKVPNSNKSGAKHEASLNNDGESNCLDNAKAGYNRIRHNEKMQEEYRKQYAVQSVLTAKHEEEIKEKEKEAKKLKDKVGTLEAELKNVKKRNGQLAIILSQAELKEKYDILEQVDNLTSVKDELTDQVVKLTQDLEQEKSKVRSLKSELDKLKGSKHNKGDSKHS
ncbi:G kinase-anchoring protein 1 isoform X1 [Octopus bimaculoides]|uniref:G kinase-anchoring protein 1 n=1 Tax=Octopus bimaculoides TaxID=37653 RepID=A0A0L8GQJ0_OCTBM|nr:G kinase-anchoring protein 1 isoform X1 [Octopus bimaculoides]|eukprot:XP_014778939.1 PREDICTED: G kinase-anchoring protein 1-like isoform X1 [Octopus bimaculoides]